MYTFQEVAFLIYKLSKMLKSRSIFMPQKIEVEDETNNKEERKLSCKEVVRSKRDTCFNLEKISSLQELGLDAV